jgi:hypothetical protein
MILSENRFTLFRIMRMTCEVIDRRAQTFDSQVSRTNGVIEGEAS